MKVFLVTPAGDLAGRHGFGFGVLEAEHCYVLVSFLEFMDEEKRQDILYSTHQTHKAPPKRQGGKKKASAWTKRKGRPPPKLPAGLIEEDLT